MSITGHKTRSVFDRYNIVSDGDLTEAVGKLAAFQQGQPGESSGPASPIRKTSTVPAQIASRATGSENAHHSGAKNAATGTHGVSVDCATAFSPAAFPATVPELHAHWKLNPPNLPSTSRISPQR
jgi:hypothetical protein